MNKVPIHRLNAPPINGWPYGISVLGMTVIVCTRDGWIDGPRRCDDGFILWRDKSKIPPEMQQAVNQLLNQMGDDFLKTAQTMPMRAGFRFVWPDSWSRFIGASIDMEEETDDDLL